MKVFIGILLAVALASAQVSATRSGLTDTCFKKYHELVDGYEPPAAVDELATKLENVIDLPKYIEDFMSLNKPRSVRNDVTFDRPIECDQPRGIYRELEGACGFFWIFKLPEETLNSSDSKKFTRAYFACHAMAVHH